MGAWLGRALPVPAFVAGVFASTGGHGRESLEEVPLACDGGPTAMLSFAGEPPAGVVDGLRTVAGSEPSQASGKRCRVMFSEERLDDVPSHIDHLLTASLSRPGWLGRNGRAHFLDTAAWRLHDADEALARKTRTLSVLLPPRSQWDGLMEALYAEAKALGTPAYIDDGTQETHDAAFGDARFSWIVEARNESIHPAFLRAMGHFTVPVYTGWVLYTNMFHNAVIRHWPKRGAVHELLWQLRYMLGNREDITMVKYHLTILDILLYRYRAPFPDRLQAVACALCRPRSALAVVGIYSAARNFEKRAAVRETWGRWLLERSVRVTFFLGAPSSGGADSFEDERAAKEAEEFGDMIRLPVAEGYTQNAKKGLEFLRYYAEREADASFLVKVDDDVYWRPEPLLRMLEERVPFRYIWGFLDLGSPVPREQRDAFFHTMEDWPDDIFPPYARGVLRVLSMDVVELVARAARRTAPTITGDDPSLGMHLRQLVLQDGVCLQLDDRGAMTRFAMEPTCRTEGVYCPLKPTTWTVHHVSARTIRCMFRQDFEGGYYSRRPDGSVETHDLQEFPSLCSCVDRRGVWRRTGSSRRRLWRSPRPQCAAQPIGGVRA